MSDDDVESRLAQEIFSAAFEPSTNRAFLAERLARASLESVDSVIKGAYKRVRPPVEDNFLLGLEELREASRLTSEQLLIDLVCLGGMRTLIDDAAQYDRALTWGADCSSLVSPSTRHLILGDMAIAATSVRDANRAIHYAQMALAEAQHLGYAYWIARYHGLLATTFTRDGQFRKALVEFDSAIGLGALLPEFDVGEKYQADRALVAAALAEEPVDPVE